jgi:hypothetical protein
MLTIATIQDGASFFSGLGVDLFDGTRGDVGCGMGVDLGADMLGTGRCDDVFLFATGGAAGAAVDVAQTGTAGDAAPLLAGASGIDTLEGADVASTGSDLLQAAVVDTAVGINMLWTRDPLPSASVSCDLSVDLILHRIALFSALAPASVGYRTGCAA